MDSFRFNRLQSEPICDDCNQERKQECANNDCYNGETSTNGCRSDLPSITHWTHRDDNVPQRRLNVAKWIEGSVREVEGVIGALVNENAVGEWKDRNQRDHAERRQRIPIHWCSQLVSQAWFESIIITNSLTVQRAVDWSTHESRLRHKVESEEHEW